MSSGFDLVWWAMSGWNIEVIVNAIANKGKLLLTEPDELIIEPMVILVLSSSEGAGNVFGVPYRCQAVGRQDVCP
jgi:hypothetical protein